MGVTYTDEGPALPVCPACMDVDRVDVVLSPRWNPDARYLCGRCVLSFTGSAGEQAAQRAWEATERAKSDTWKSKAEKVAEARKALDGAA